MSKVLVCVMLLAVAAVAEARQAEMTGTVRDGSGGVVSGATVLVRSPAGFEGQAVTDPQGIFTIVRPSTPGATLLVRAGGFAEWEAPLPASGPVDVVLAAASVFESVTVTPSRTEQRLGDVPASVNVVDRETIRRSPAVVADDVLRLVPTFSLFRRSSSLSSHPTAQGVSLRGVGPSGVSRTLVLLDGVPFNDPFGGWVYWTRVPLDSVSRIEIVDGSSSSVYGNYAMGGVINVVSVRPQPRTAEARLQYGNNQSGKGDFFASDVFGALGVSLDGSFFGTDGFPIVSEEARGPVDTKASVDYQNLNVKLDYSPSPRVSAFFRGGYFSEDRDNAKVTTFAPATPESNDTVWRSASGGVRLTLPDQSDVQARVFSDFETFRSNFMAVPNPVARDVGRMTLLQRVPTTGVGAAVQWTKAPSTRYLWSAGVDVRHVDGASEEQGLDPATGTVVTLERESGGTQMSSGAYVQGQFWALPNLSFTASARVDRWRNYNARNLETTVATGQPTAGSTTLPDRSDTAVSPRAAALYRIGERVTAWGSIGGGFRAPTLNELYRQFRVGAVLTMANDQLGPERLVGGELGLNVAPTSALSVRTTWFDNRVKNPVSNVTIETNLQQRQNLGRTRIWGVQTDVDYRLGTEWRVGGGYLYNQATVREFSARPELVGRFLPQVPVHRGSVNLTYNHPRVTATVNAMFFGRQFNEDLNDGGLPGAAEPGLPGYAVLEVSASHRFSRRLEAFAGVQNLFDKEYYVGLNPVTIGSPRLVNAGIRVLFAGR